MATKFYFHQTAASGGTLPSSTTLFANGAAAINVAASGAGTPLEMTETIGSGQTSVALTTQAVTSTQANLFRRFISAPLAAQTIASQTLTLSLAASESNGASDMFEVGSLAVSLWRPGTGAFVSSLVNPLNMALSEPSGSQTAVSSTISSTSRTSSDGDVLVVEIGSTQAQTMTTSYTNTIFFDGATEASTTDCASFINFANTLTFLAGGTTYTKAGFGVESA